MRKLKRIVALVTVALFLISVAAPSAFAATKEDAFGRLKAVSVAIGDTSGDPMYDKNFTRAEAAAIMVNLSGMKEAIASAKGATKFKDVAASHWASGVINLAVGAGIIKGYPNGSYMPDANVTYAEMCAMLVQVLGYGPKLQGTWPTNVIGKAAELGLLDGVSVTDYNSAAVRSNVFLAADNSLDTKPLKEMKDGYEEDDLTLMQRKLNVEVTLEGSVTATPAYGGLDKNKVKISSVTETLTTLESVNPDDYYGLKVEAWVKDDKVFFLDVKTDSSDIIVDTLEELRLVNDVVYTGTPAVIDSTNETLWYSVKLDTSNKVISVRPVETGSGDTLRLATEYKKNFDELTPFSATGNYISNGGAVKIILGSDGKADYVISTGYKNAIVSSIDATNEKINLDSETVWSGYSYIELKDKKVKLYRNGVAAKLADLVKGDVLDYIDVDDVKVIYANDKTETGKLTAVYDDGLFKDKTWRKFKFKVGDKELKSVKCVFISTDNGDNFDKKTGTTTASPTAFTSVINKDVTVKLSKSGQAAYIIAGAASADTDIPVYVKYIRKASGAEDKPYVYVGKVDGTNTYYEVTKNTKIDGTKINEYALKGTDGSDSSIAKGDWTLEGGPRITTGIDPDGTDVIDAGTVVKVNLSSDGKVNEFKTYSSTDLEITDPADPQFEVNKDNSTIKIGSGTTLYIDSNTKMIRVEEFVYQPVNENDGIEDTDTPYVDEVESITWAALKSLNGNNDCDAVVVKDNGKAKYIFILDWIATLSTGDYFGVVVNKGINYDGDEFLRLGYDGKEEDLEGTIPDADKKEVVRFTLEPDGTISVGEVLNAKDVYSGVYTYRVDEISGAQLTLIPINSDGSDITGDSNKRHILISLTKTKIWDTDIDTATPVIISDLNTIQNMKVQVYDVWDSDGLLTDDDDSDGNPDGDGIFDFVMVTKK